MRTAGELSGLAVVTEAAGERIGRIHDVLFDPSSEGAGRVTGFLVKESGSMFAKTKLLPRLLARSLGPDALLVEPGAVLGEIAGSDTAIIPGSLSAHELNGRPVLDTTGTAIGNVADVLIDESAMCVVAFLLSTGLLGNLLHGKPQLPLGQIQAIGTDSVVTVSTFDIKSTSFHPPH